VTAQVVAMAAIASKYQVSLGTHLA
jgi:hypothetical protein